MVAGLHSLAASNLGADEAPGEDALVCGDDADAKAIVLELAERITAGRAIDCGPLASARALEGLTAMIVNVNKRYRRTPASSSPASLSRRPAPAGARDSARGNPGAFDGDDLGALLAQAPTRRRDRRR